jgi:hypothetical protein
MTTHDPFEVWLERNLNADLDRLRGTSAPPTPRYRAQRTTRRVRVLGLTSIPVAISLRLVTALAAAGVAAGGGAAVMIASHSPKPPASTALSGTSRATGSVTTTADASSGSGATSSSGTATNHGQVVTSAVASCQAARTSPVGGGQATPGSRGIGACVSTTANGGKPHPVHPTPKPHPTPHPHPTPKPHPTPHG